MGDVTIGIDIGTTSVKAVAADADGVVLSRTRIPHVVRAPNADVFEHDPSSAWRDGVVAAWEQVATDHDVAGAAVAAMVPSLCGVDPTGAPVTPGLLYGDRRGGEEADILGFARWLRAESDATSFWPAQAVANHTLCGVGAIDTTTASAMVPLFDGQAWDGDLCRSLGIGPEQLPELSPGSAPIGDVAGAALAGGTIDAFAEQLVAGADDVGDVLVICGTTLICWAITDEWREVDGLWTMPYSAPERVAIGGASNAGGVFIDTVCAATNSVEEPELDALDPRRLPVWLPYLRGERTPLHDPDRRASLLDFEVGHGGAALQRAAYEAAGFVVRHHLDLAATSPTRIVAAGGGTRSAPWMQALADTTGLPVDVSAIPEGAALGAAYLGRIAAGLETDTAGAARWARHSHRVEPREVWADACEPRYQRFREATAGGV
jgi:xylulokinase